MGSLLAGGLLLPLAASAIPARPNPTPSCRYQEKATYAVIFMGAQAGTFTLAAGPAADGKCLEEAQVKTDLAFRLFYRVTNTYRSESDPASSTPSSFLTLLDESKQHGSVLQEFSRRKKKVVIRTDIQKKEELVKEEKTRAINPLTQDVISALFYLRGQDLALGKTFDVPVFIGEEEVPLRLQVAEQDKIHTKLGERDTWILKLIAAETDSKKPLPETQVWIAKDGARPILKIKAKAKIGSVTAYISEYEDHPAAADSAGTQTANGGSATL